MKRDMKNNRKKYLAAGTAACLLAISLSGCTSNVAIPDTIKVQSADEVNQITTSGREEVKVVPDMAKIVFAVHTQASSAETCQQDNAKNLDATIQMLKELGVEERSIQTSSYGMNPIQDWNSSTQTITGYEMETQLTVSDISLDQAGTLLSQAVTAGVNSIERVEYFCSDYDAKYQEALQKAIAMAHTKAQVMAEAEARQLGSVVNIKETNYNPDARYAGYTSGSGAYQGERAAAAMDMSVMAGQVSVEASVEVTYQMQ
ncbi:MAG: SIMPL domain-containing protein [Lachnospiraceae bacterium]|nr:SIMPL domain-containing protein [Lachnospiraceae bacterium]